MSSLRRRSGTILDLFLPLVILLTPFISFISYNEYSWSAPETWISIAILSAIGLLGVTVMMLGPAWLRVLGTAVLLMLFVDLQFDWFDVDREYRIPAFGVGILLLCWLLRDHLSRIMVPAFAAMLMANLVIPDRSQFPSFQRVGASADAETNRNLAPPPVVHLILDEFIGIEGIPSEAANGREVRDRLRTFLRANGFAVYGRAYSRFVRTSNSIPNTLNYTAIPENAALLEIEQDYKGLRKNKYFNDMAQQGYRIHVFQPNYIDFCGDDIHVLWCRTFPMTGIKPVERLELSPILEAELILKNFVSLSITEQMVRRYYILLGRKIRKLGYDWPSWWLNRARTSTVEAMHILNIVAQRAAKARAGDLFFVHVLLPHGPYVYDRTCGLRDPRDWDGRFEGVGVVNTDESRLQRYVLYLEQVECVQAKLEAMFNLWRRAGLYDRMKIILHGDHGSRIYMTDPTIPNADRLHASDYVDGFSALFAVKAPGLDPAYDTRMVAIQDLLPAVVHNRLDQLTVDDKQPYVLIERSYGEAPHPMIRRPMPGPGCAAGQRWGCNTQVRAPH